MMHAVGPGNSARRGATHFYQDLAFLRAAGAYLAPRQAFHVGDWHSHHTLQLSQPSEGDVSTCVDAMLRNDKNWFLIFIVNLAPAASSLGGSPSAATVTVSPYRFTSNTPPNNPQHNPRVFETGELIIVPPNQVSAQHADEHAALETIRAAT